MPLPFRAVTEGFREGGASVFEIDDPNDYPECDFVFGCGIPKRSLIRMSAGRKAEFYYMDKLFQTQSERGGSVLVLDGGYIKRASQVARADKAYYSLGFNGLNGRAKFVNENMSSDRWNKLGVELKPWRDKGEHILFCAQKKTDASVQHIKPALKSAGLSYVKWERQTLLELALLTDKSIIFRPHPCDQRHPKGVILSKNLNGPIEIDLKNCYLLCSFNSNSAVEATIEGIPVMTFDEGCMVWEGCNQHLSPEGVASPKNFDRDNWKNGIAYSQWNPEEMASGEAFDHLKLVLSSGIKLNYEDGIPSNMNL